MKSSMRLDAADDANVVGLGRAAVQQDGITFWRGSEGNHVHRRPDGDADVFLGNAVALENAALSFGRAAAVAAHCRDEEGTGAEPFQKANRLAQDERDVGDAAAAGRESDRLTGTNAPAQIKLFEGGRDGAGWVLDARPLETLAEANEIRIGHGGTP